MNNQTKVQQVVDIMRAKGATEEQIAKFFEDLTKTNFARFYAQAMAVFTDEDMKAIEDCKSDEETNKLIKDLYKQRTNMDAEAEMQKFLDDFAQGFIAEHAKNPNATS